MSILSRLDFLQGTRTIWICSKCSQKYDTSIQDVQLRDISSTRVEAYSEFQYYPTFDADDPDMVFIQGINLEEQSLPGDVEILREDGFRIKHITAEAISVMNSMDNIPS